MAKISVHLGQEIIAEILAVLPVKSVLRFRCVSKSWRSLIDSQFFINKRLECSTYANKSLIFNHETPELNHCPLLCYRQEAGWVPSPIDDPANNHLMTGRVVGSCRGILCILKQDVLFLWNPTIRKSLELPAAGIQQISKFWFGWEEDTDAYKVFVVVSERDQKIGKLYSSKTKSWKTVDHGSLSLCDEFGLCLRGKIHWLVKTSRHIEYFDLKSEVFGMIEQPCKPEDGLYLKVRKECLSIICSNKGTCLDMWVMKKYGEKESWVKKCSFPVPSQYNTDDWVSFFYSKSKGVRFLPRKKIIGCENWYSYTESLVSPDGTMEEDSSEKNEIVTREQVLETGVARGRRKQQNNREPKKRRVMLMNKKKVTKEIEQEQVHASVAESRPKRQRRMPARYGIEEEKENEQFRATDVYPRKRKRGEEIGQERVDKGISEGRPKRQNIRRPARYDT